MTRQQFHTIDRLKLQVEGDPVGGRKNLLRNPDGELGTWDWINLFAPTALAARVVDGASRFVLSAPAAASPVLVFNRTLVKVAPGRWVGATLKLLARSTTAEFIDVRFNFRRAGQASIQGPVTTLSTVSPNAVSIPPAQAPAGTTVADLQIYARSSVGGDLAAGRWVEYTDVAMVEGATQASVMAPTYPATTWVDVLGATYDIAIDRRGLDVGTLTATIRSATLDPAISTALRPGRRVRALALTAAGTWESLFHGHARTAPATYDQTQTDPNRRVKISLVAVDPNSDAANINATYGTGTVTEGVNVFELADGGVPWAVNGSGDQPAGQTSATTSANSIGLTLADQVAITRDTSRGYAWCDRFGRINLSTAAAVATVKAILDPADYSGLEVGYDTSDLVNRATVRLLRWDADPMIPGVGQTVEVRYGPYTNDESIDAWGPFPVEYTVQGIPDTEAAAASFAQAVLATNAMPAVRVKSARVPILTADAFTLTDRRVFLDLYDRVTVALGTDTSDDRFARYPLDDKYPTTYPAEMAVSALVTRVTHRITATKWLLDLEFTSYGTAALPQVTPTGKAA